MANADPSILQCRVGRVCKRSSIDEKYVRRRHDYRMVLPSFHRVRSVGSVR